MNKHFNSLLIILIPLVTFAQTGKVYDNLTFPSKILNSERKYAIYLPPDYETSERSYPVLYLLHGSGDDQSGWVQFGEVLGITDKAIAEGSSTAMIIVMPDANTGKKGYVNRVGEDWRYEDFFFEELIPYVEKKYRIKSDKRIRPQLILWLKLPSNFRFINGRRRNIFLCSSSSGNVLISMSIKR